MIDHKKFETLVKDRKQKQNDWVKVCVTSISALLGLLIAFEDKSCNNLTSNILFSITIISMSLLILTGLLFLYNDTDTSSRLIAEYLKKTNNLAEPLTQQFGVNERKIFLKLRTVFFILLFLSVVSLTVYGVYSRFI